MPVDQEVPELAAVASLLTTDLLYLVRDPGAGETALKNKSRGAIINLQTISGEIWHSSKD